MLNKFASKIFHAVLLLCIFGGCSAGLETTDKWAAAMADYSQMYGFVRSAAASGDYCTGISSSSTGLTVTLASGASFTTASSCPLVTMNRSGSLSSGGTDLGITLDVRSTWYDSPSVSISSERRLSIEGKATGLISGGLCAIDCGKFVWFWFNGESVALPSEIHEMFNPPLPRNKGILKVLFVGNSFNVDATAHLPGILAANGTRRVLMGRTYHGGYTLPQYDDAYSSDKQCSYRVCRPGETDWDGDEEYDTNLQYAVEAEDWDVITFMEYTGNSACWSWTEAEKGHINSLIRRVFDAHPGHRPTVMFMLTQTFAAQSDLVKNSFGGDQMRMYATITDFARNVLDDTCIDDVIATGTAVQNLRTSSLNTDKVQDLSRDGFHLDYGVSRYAAACTVFYNIFEPCLGLSLDGNAYRYAERIDHPTAHSIPVTDVNVGLCRWAARLATDNPLEATDMSAY